MIRWSSLVALLSFASCGGGLERASFDTDLLSYEPGGRVGLSLVNVSTLTLGINLCLSQLVQEDRKTTGPADDESCSLEAIPLAPGERFDARKLVPAATPAGTWRYETTLRLPNGTAEKVFTPPFTVAR
jgi:hypothetical protein